jgi:hypothetical protein
MPRERPVWIAGRQVEVSPVRKFQVPRANPQSPPQTPAAFDDVARSYRKPAGKLTGMESHGYLRNCTHANVRKVTGADNRSMTREGGWGNLWTPVETVFFRAILPKRAAKAHDLAYAWEGSNAFAKRWRLAQLAQQS